MSDLKITVLANGPYMVDGQPPLLDPAGDPIEAKERYFLCRCGGSSNKPFCNGTHNTNGFDGTEVADRSPIGSRRKAYRGDGVTIFDDRSVCAHAGFCTDRLPTVWNSKQSPWIAATGAPADEIVATVSACPSGALAYALGDSDDPVVAAGEPRIEPMADGPYVVRGGILLASPDETPYEARTPYTLCRCGASKNKPFCDGTHSDIGFRA